MIKLVRQGGGILVDSESSRPTKLVYNYIFCLFMIVCVADELVGNHLILFPGHLYGTQVTHVVVACQPSDDELAAWERLPNKPCVLLASWLIESYKSVRKVGLHIYSYMFIYVKMIREALSIAFADFDELVYSSELCAFLLAPLPLPFYCTVF